MFSKASSQGKWIVDWLPYTSHYNLRIIIESGFKSSEGYSGTRRVYCVTYFLWRLYPFSYAGPRNQLFAKCSFLPYLNACILWLCAQPCMWTGLFVILTEWKALKRTLNLRFCIDFVIILQHKRNCLQFL